MKKLLNWTLILTLSLFLAACGKSEKTESGETGHSEEAGNMAAHEEHEDENPGTLHLPAYKVEKMKIEVDTLPLRNLHSYVVSNGTLEVPPQHEATVTAILGANILEILVMEGDKVSKGEVLAYVQHPRLSELQTRYLQNYHQLQYLQKEYERQKALYSAHVGSGKDFQKTESEYESLKAGLTGLESQLRQLNLDPERIKSERIYEKVPVISPINGYIEKVFVQLGQYVNPQDRLFMVVNTDYIHADLMVFEKDVHLIRAGQELSFTVQSLPDEEITARIYSVGRTFEQNPKAVHIHARIDRKNEFLIPGMYISARINTGDRKVHALPESAIIAEGEKKFIFAASQHVEDGEKEWEFQMIEVWTGVQDGDWVEVHLFEKLPEGTKVVWENAYYLISEMKKSQTSHSH